MDHTFFEQCRLWLGIEKNHTSHSEKLISGLGALLGIAVTAWWSFFLVKTGVLSIHSSILIITSLGATSVLIFAVPHGALSQPWQVFAGHMVSALVGVTCQKFIGANALSAGIAVGLAVTIMYYLRCTHPPGGATALTAVVGGPEIVALGYEYLVYPLLINLVIIMLAAIAFNYLFHWRRYPAHLSVWQKPPLITAEYQTAVESYELTTEDFNAAIREHNSFVDVTEEGLSELLELAKQHAIEHAEHPSNISAGHYYSNGKIGRLWSVRHVIDSSESHSGKDSIIYKTVAGLGTFDSNVCSRENFRQWARFEVLEYNGMWIKANSLSARQDG